MKNLTLIIPVLLLAYFLFSGFKKEEVAKTARETPNTGPRVSTKTTTGNPQPPASPNTYGQGRTPTVPANTPANVATPENFPNFQIGKRK